MPTSLVRTFRAALAGAVLCAAASAQVQATLVAGSLFVDGGAAAENVSISVLGDFVRVSGLGGTTVNGLAQDTFTGVVGEIVVAMGDGDDFLTMTDSTTLGTMRVDLGAGDDTFFATRNVINGDWVISAGPAGVFGDLVALAGSDQVGNTVAGELCIFGNGLALGLRGTTVGGNVLVSTGGRRDKLLISGNNFAGSLDIASRGGDDWIALASEPGVGPNLIGGCLQLLAGGGNDLIELGAATTAQSDIGVRAGIVAGAGDDTVTVRNMRFNGPTLFRGGSGVDALEAQSPVFGNVFAATVGVLDFENVQ